MKKSLFTYAAVSILAILSATAAMQTYTRAATPSPSTTFPSLTTIYVASGAYDGGGGGDQTGAATSIHCSNVSGQSAQVRVLIVNHFRVASAATDSLAHGTTRTFSTHDTVFGLEVNLSTGLVVQGVLNVESTQSGVFCSAMIVPAATPEHGVALHMVRVNPHPGTVE